MTASIYQRRTCPGCGASILGDTTEPLTRDPYVHEDDCPEADPWEATDGD